MAQRSDVLWSDTLLHYPRAIVLPPAPRSFRLRVYRANPSPPLPWLGIPTAVTVSSRRGFALTWPSGLILKRMIVIASEREYWGSQAYQREGLTLRSGNTFELTAFRTRSPRRRHPSGMEASTGAKSRSEKAFALSICLVVPSFLILPAQYRNS